MLALQTEVDTQNCQDPVANITTLGQLQIVQDLTMVQHWKTQDGCHTMSRCTSWVYKHTLRIWAASSGLGTVCIPVPSTSQTSARPMDHRPVSPEANSALPRKNMGRRRRRSHGLAPVLICHTARPATAICSTSPRQRKSATPHMQHHVVRRMTWKHI